MVGAANYGKLNLHLTACLFLLFLRNCAKIKREYL